jgi:kynurenine 3-monooxygenase
MDYQQEYISHEYIELKMPAGTDTSGGECFLLDPNYLHIWPRHSFMLIACPNKVYYLAIFFCSFSVLKCLWKDKTFTCTLFAPKSELDRLTSRAAASAWLKAHFIDAVNLIGEETLLNDFQQNPRSSIISVKVRRIHEPAYRFTGAERLHSRPNRTITRTDA